MGCSSSKPLPKEEAETFTKPTVTDVATAQHAAAASNTAIAEQKSDQHAASAAAKPATDKPFVDLAVVENGHVTLQSSVGKTGFQGLAKFEDAERQQANDSIMKCFKCCPGQLNDEQRFDSITNLLAGIFQMPVALVVFLDSSLAYIKSEHGMSQAEGATARGLSFCTWTLVTLKPEVQVIQDTNKDGRFKTHPYVAGLPHLRFYAGAPLISSRGHRLGSLCLCDYKPRVFDAECSNILCNFAEIVVRDAERFMLEEGVDPLVEGGTAAGSSTTGSLIGTPGPPVRDLGFGGAEAPTAVALVSAKEPGWPMLFVSPGFAEATGISEAADGSKPFWELFWQPATGSGVAPAVASEAFAEKVAHGASFIVEVLSNNVASDAVLLVRFRPAALENIDAHQVHVNINIPGKIRKAVDLNPQAYYFATVQKVSRSGSASAGSFALHDPQAEVPFEDVQLGGLLGKGSYGSVYIGLTTSGSPVAVKVIEHRANAQTTMETAKEELEAILGMQLDHPNIVRTIKFATRQQAAAAALQLRPKALRSRGSGALAGSSQAAGSGTPAGSATPAGSRQAAGSGTPAGSTRATGRGTPSGSGLAAGSGTPAASQRDDDGGSKRPWRTETWIVLELCDQGSLQAAIDEGCFRQTGSMFDGTPDMKRILSTATEIASAMEYLHARGTLHGDLTANNILLSGINKDGTPAAAGLTMQEFADGTIGELQPSANFVAKVSDFGLSRAAATESAMSTNTFGTVTHMPPELLRDGRLSKAADVYAFGVLLWEMYVGERPWAGMRPVTIILKKTQDKMHLQWPAGTPPAYQELGDACMASDHTLRPSFTETLAALARLQEAARRGELEPGKEFAVYHQFDKAAPTRLAAGTGAGVINAQRL